MKIISFIVFILFLSTGPVHGQVGSGNVFSSANEQYGLSGLYYRLLAGEALMIALNEKRNGNDEAAEEFLEAWKQYSRLARECMQKVVIRFKLPEIDQESLVERYMKNK